MMANIHTVDGEPVWREPLGPGGEAADAAMKRLLVAVEVADMLGQKRTVQGVSAIRDQLDEVFDGPVGHPDEGRDAVRFTAGLAIHYLTQPRPVASEIDLTPPTLADRVPPIDLPA